MKIVTKLRVFSDRLFERSHGGGGGGGGGCIEGMMEREGGGDGHQWSGGQQRGGRAIVGWRGVNSEGIQQRVFNLEETPFTP